MALSKSCFSVPEFVLWLMIANGNPQMLTIASIRNILEVLFMFFMILPPSDTERPTRIPLRFAIKK
jgi:hypothetical protein